MIAIRAMVLRMVIYCLIRDFLFFSALAEGVVSNGTHS